MMSKWSDFYKKRMTQSYVDHVKKQYKPFIDEIITTAHQIGNKPRILEAGCGIGTVTKALVQDGLFAEMCAFDLCKDQAYSAALNLFGSGVAVFEGNILEPGSYYQCDIIHSHGVLEHFSDNDISIILSNQKSVCNNLIHYVPLAGWITGSFGDERLLPLEHWLVNFKPSSYRIFNEGKDACLIWKQDHGIS